MTGIPISFNVGGHSAVAMLHKPRPEKATSLGLIILVGGPTYRIGAHRQYLKIAQAAQEQGHWVLRFDWLGVGDSDGDYTSVYDLGPQLLKAAETLKHHAKGVEKIALWGLCEGASTSLLHGSSIPQYCGAVLVNPWVDDLRLEAQSRLRDYYLKRAMTLSFWKRLLTGRLNLSQATKGVSQDWQDSKGVTDTENLSDAMARGALKGPAFLYIASEMDQTRQIFDRAIANNSLWQKVRTKPYWKEVFIKAADHLCTQEDAHTSLVNETLHFLHQLRQQDPSPAPPHHDHPISKTKR